MVISRARKALLLGTSAAVVACLGAATLATGVHAAPQATTTTAFATDMPLAVEDLSYPGADRIYQDRGITLKRGDGHIILTEHTSLAQCSDPSNIMVESWKGAFCFKANAKSGYLTLELPDTFNIWTQDHPVRATLTAEGEQTVVNAPANDLTAVGEAGDTGLRSALVELRVTG
ncbi:hypothetical protein ACIHCM_35505 [Streptomyces sp. NPDC052023]|uniref:hypothetical protein n=1 Tax=Streptomyces sp. NPDC052023 TaxID=3365681 RepID=UPI0037CF483F